MLLKLHKICLLNWNSPTYWDLEYMTPNRKYLMISLWQHHRIYTCNGHTFTSLTPSTHSWDIYLQWAHIHILIGKYTFTGAVQHRATSSIVGSHMLLKLHKICLLNWNSPTYWDLECRKYLMISLWQHHRIYTCNGHTFTSLTGSTHSRDICFQWAHIHNLNGKYTFTTLTRSTHSQDIYLQRAHIHIGTGKYTFMGYIFATGTHSHTHLWGQSNSEMGHFSLTLLVKSAHLWIGRHRQCGVNNMRKYLFKKLGLKTPPNETICLQGKSPHTMIKNFINNLPIGQISPSIENFAVATPRVRPSSKRKGRVVFWLCWSAHVFSRVNAREVVAWRPGGCHVYARWVPGGCHVRSLLRQDSCPLHRVQPLLKGDGGCAAAPPLCFFSIVGSNMLLKLHKICLLNWNSPTYWDLEYMIPNGKYLMISENDFKK